jgi:hypothetical protein
MRLCYAAQDADGLTFGEGVVTIADGSAQPALVDCGAELGDGDRVMPGLTKSAAHCKSSLKLVPVH